jgi:DNA-directed RNA polymerase subunit RPC12/RpoP
MQKYRCEECGRIFNKPVEIQEEHGEVFVVCPTCLSTDYCNVFKCSLCDRYITYDEIHKDICYECATKEYADRLGLKFIEVNKDFYLDFYGVEKVDKDLKSNLIEILEKDFLSKVDMDTDWNKQLKSVKEYCLEDIDDWIEFLKEEI